MTNYNNNNLTLKGSIFNLITTDFLLTDNYLHISLVNWEVEVQLWTVNLVVRFEPVRSIELMNIRILLSGYKTITSYYLTVTCKIIWQISYMKLFTPSLTLVYLYPTFLQTSYYQSFVILEVDLPISIQISHRHPTVNILLRWIVLHSHHVVRLPNQLWNLVLTQKTTLVTVEFLKQPLCHLQPLPHILSVCPS